MPISCNAIPKFVMNCNRWLGVEIDCRLGGFPPPDLTSTPSSTQRTDLRLHWTSLGLGRLVGRGLCSVSRSSEQTSDKLS